MWTMQEKQPVLITKQQTYSRPSSRACSLEYRQCPVWSIPEPSFDISIPMFQLSVEEVLQALEDLDGKKGPGADGLSPLLFKNCAATLVHPITDVFNRSLVQMKFPSVWK